MSNLLVKTKFFLCVLITTPLASLFFTANIAAAIPMTGETRKLVENI